ncbi:MAG: metallopeptidase family protein [Bdellovibrionales bacterium]
MNFTVSPGHDDLRVIAGDILETLPDELVEYCQDLTTEIAEFPDDALQSDLDLDDPYELLAFYKSGKALAPGVEKKNADVDDVLLLFRRPILDLWCESGDDLTFVMREVMIEEIARTFDFSDTEIDEMTQRHFQGML